MLYINAAKIVDEKVCFPNLNDFPEQKNKAIEIIFRSLFFINVRKMD